MRHGRPNETFTEAAELEGSLAAGFRATGRTLPVKRLLAPLDPVAIYATGLNYADHAAETGASIPEHPVFFMKSPRSVIGPGDAIRIPRALPTEQVDYEAELAVLIGRDCRSASRAAALDFVAGYTCANDVSARDWQLHRAGRQWCRAKSFDTFCPLGPCVADAAELGGASDLSIRTLLNGTVMQASRTSQFLFDVAALIEFFSADTTLPAGSVLLTGTPGGVGMARTPPVWLAPGDVVTVEIERIGALTNPVTAGTP